MTLNGWIQIALYCAIIVALVKPLGWYMTRACPQVHAKPVRSPCTIQPMSPSSMFVLKEAVKA